MSILSGAHILVYYYNCRSCIVGGINNFQRALSKTDMCCVIFSSSMLLVWLVCLRRRLLTCENVVKTWKLISHAFEARAWKICAGGSIVQCCWFRGLKMGF